jgi:hypothetical protein
MLPDTILTKCLPLPTRSEDAVPIFVSYAQDTGN